MLSVKQWETKMKGHMERDKDGERHQKKAKEECDYCLPDNGKIHTNKG